VTLDEGLASRNAGAQCPSYSLSWAPRVLQSGPVESIPRSGRKSRACSLWATGRQWSTSNNALDWHERRHRIGVHISTQVNRSPSTAEDGSMGQNRGQIVRLVDEYLRTQGLTEARGSGATQDLNSAAHPLHRGQPGEPGAGAQCARAAASTCSRPPTAWPASISPSPRIPISSSATSSSPASTATRLRRGCARKRGSISAFRTHRRMFPLTARGASAICRAAGSAPFQWRGRADTRPRTWARASPGTSPGRCRAGRLSPSGRGSRAGAPGRRGRGPSARTSRGSPRRWRRR
jgi:hypothetical protein